MTPNTNTLERHFSGQDFDTSGAYIHTRKPISGDSLIKPSDWFEVPYGSAAADFPANWQTLNSNGSENAIITTDTPAGEQGLVWECKASGNRGADGGFNNGGGIVEVDISYAYRLSAWMRRFGTAAGSDYLGLYAYKADGSTNALSRSAHNNNAPTGNMYFYTNDTAQDAWVYVEGIVHAVDRPNKTAKSGGVYKRHTAAKVQNVNRDARFTSETKYLGIRAYQFYHGNAGDALQVWRPRIDKLDGTEPSRENLLGIV